MTNSILNDIKMSLGVPIHVKDFDGPILIHCNTVFSALTQMGVGPKEGFFIVDDAAEWRELIGEHNIQNVRSYVYLKVKLLFDAPANGVLIQVIERQISEIEWRIRMEVDK